MMHVIPLSFIALVFLCPISNVWSSILTDLGIDLYDSAFAMNDYMLVHVQNRNRARFIVLMVPDRYRVCYFDMRSFFSNSYFITEVVVPSIGDLSWNVFFYSVRLSDFGIWNTTWIFRVEVLMQSCTYSASLFERFEDNPLSFNPVMGVAKDGERSVCLLSTFSRAVDYSTVGLVEDVHLAQNLAVYRPDILETLYIDYLALMAGEKLINGLYIPTLYLINYSPVLNLSTYVDSWTPSLPYSWQRVVSNTFLDAFSYTLRNASSIAVNKNGEILFGVPSLNTVYCLRVNPANSSSLIFRSSRMNEPDTPAVGYGKSVAWLDNDTAVILANSYSLDYGDFYYSRIEIYDLSVAGRLTDSSTPYAVFPDTRQTRPNVISAHFVQVTASYYGAIALMDSKGYVYVILPLDESYYVSTKTALYWYGSAFSAQAVICPPGTIRLTSGGPKEILSSCVPCSDGQYYHQLPSGVYRCSPCLAGMFCPIGATAPIPNSYLENRSQATSYPKSTEASAFDDVLLSNMFSLNFRSHCFFVAPMFWTMCMLGLAVLWIILMAVLRCTGKCPSLLDAFLSIFTHFDIINEGERWIGGVLSFAILIMIAYAALFTNSFLMQYPMSESKAPDFTCDDSLRNSDFFTSMKPLNNYMAKQPKTIFNLMSRQRYRIIVTFFSIETTANISVSQRAGSTQKSLPCSSSSPEARVLIYSCYLQSTLGSVVFEMANIRYLGGMRLAMTASKLVEDNLQAQAVDFIYTYRIPSHIIASEPYFNIEMTPVVNETKPLSSGGVSKISGIWLPVINKDDTQNFVTREEHQANQQTTVTLTIELTQANYYISNQERPLVRTNRAIFKNILFASTCMELFSFGFLLMKLAILPLCQFILRKSRKNKDGEHNPEEEVGEEEEAEDEDEDEDDDGPEGAAGNVVPVRSEPAINEWYVDDKQE